MRWTQDGNRASNASVEIRHRDGTATLSIDQRSKGGAWNSLGEFSFTGAATEGVLISNKEADGYVVADAVSFSPAP
jgi:hypothetical protein